MKAYDFKVLLEPDETGGYVATCPSLPGCYSQGDTVDGALDNIREAIELCLEDMHAHGRPSRILRESLSEASSSPDDARAPRRLGTGGHPRVRTARRRAAAREPHPAAPRDGSLENAADGPGAPHAQTGSAATRDTRRAGGSRGVPPPAESVVTALSRRSWLCPKLCPRPPSLPPLSPPASQVPKENPSDNNALSA
jgi:predicted RNase H-like HicB family nuclease